MSVSNLYPTIAPSLNLSFALTKKLDPRITFVRTTTATVYDGKTTAKAEENLFQYSQEFDNAGWGKTNVSVTTNTATAPDGTATAETITENSSSGTHEVSQFATVNGVTYTVSVFAKRNSGTRNLTFRGAGQGGAGVHPIFDLGSGTVAQNGTGTWSNQTITLVAGGWYRCSATVVASTIANIFIGMADGTSQSYTGDDTSSIDLWGAQLEQRSAVTAYTPTTTQPITNYVPVLQTAASGVARFDHNPLTGESLGLLVEEQRTNLFVRSEEFDNASWTKGDCTVTSNVIVAPNGTLSGDAINDTVDVGNAAHQVTQGISVTSGTAYALSAYIKAGSGVGFSLGAGGTGAFSTEQRVLFNAATGVATSQLGTPTNIAMTAVGNGWYRCSCVITPTSTATATIVIRLYNSAASGFYQGNGTQYAFLWGAQLEAGAFPTSYIPTVAATVTRNADAASMTGTNFSSWFNQAGGTVYCDFTFGQDLIFVNAFSMSNAAATNNLINNRRGSSGTFDCSIVTAGTNQAVFALLNPPVVNTSHKTTVAYKFNDFACSINGGAVQTDTSGVVPELNQIGIGGTASGGEILNGHIRKISYYPSRLPDAQLQALTTV